MEDKNLAKQPEKMADEIADKVTELLGKTPPVAKIRNSQIISAIIGASGLALFLVGVEKVFVKLSGWFSIALGIILLVVSGALLRKLK